MHSVLPLPLAGEGWGRGSLRNGTRGESPHPPRFARHLPPQAGEGKTRHGVWVPAFRRDDGGYVLKKLFAASFEARFLVTAACSRSISEVISAMRSASSSTDSSDRSCPLSWVTFFLGLSSSSMAIRFSRAQLSVASRPAAG